MRRVTTGLLVLSGAVFAAVVAVPGVQAAGVPAVGVPANAGGAAHHRGASPATAATDVVAPGAADVAAPPRANLAPGRVATSADPLRVMVIGDSVMYDAEPGIAGALEATGAATVVDETILGWGLVNYSHQRAEDYNWRALWPTLLARYHPELVIGMWSWDDDVAEADPVGYASTLDDALETLLTGPNGADGVVLVQFPPSQPTPSSLTFYRATGWTRQTTSAGWESARQAWNAVAAGTASLWGPRVAFAPLAPVLEANGVYQAVLPSPTGDLTRARAIDGVHLCVGGAAILGDAVEGYVASLVHLPPPAAGWATASWTRDRRYSLQPALCPPLQGR